jgi:hypothetical protein
MFFPIEPGLELELHRIQIISVPSKMAEELDETERDVKLGTYCLLLHTGKQMVLLSSQLKMGFYVL